MNGCCLLESGLLRAGNGAEKKLIPNDEDPSTLANPPFAFHSAKVFLSFQHEDSNTWHHGRTTRPDSLHVSLMD